MIAFLAAAGVCVLAAVFLLCWPLLRARAGAHAPERLSGVLVIALLPVAAAGAYLWLSHGSWRHLQSNTPPNALTHWQNAVAQNPQDLLAWLQLGQAYTQVEQFGLAIHAYERANQVANGTNAAALAGIGEALLLGGDPSNNDRAAQLFERALVIDPQSPKALFYSALQAAQAGKTQLARDRFATMLSLNPPEPVRGLLQRQIGMLDAELAHAQPDPATAITLKIDLDPALAARLPAGGSLFVFVRNPAGGAPLAVKRLTVQFPQQISLSAADSMLPNNKLRPGQSVQVVARLSKGGAPTGQSGDLFGEINYQAGKSGSRELKINQISP
jgi:cytochrome c-type biogenesis protein CcmH